MLFPPSMKPPAQQHALLISNVRIPLASEIMVSYK